MLCFVTGISLSSCFNKIPETTPILDPCAPEMLAGTMRPLQGLMRAFDDVTDIAYNMSRPQVSEQIAELQNYRRQVAEFDVPSCLVELTALQVNYMDSVINNLLAFLGGASGDTTVVGLRISAGIRDKYEDALAVLLGVTSTPRPTAIGMMQLPASTPTVMIPVTGITPIDEIPPSPTATAKYLTPTPFSALGIVNNPDGVNVRHGPGLFYTYSVIVPLDEQIEIVGRTEDAQWLLIRDPETAEIAGWVYVPLVNLEIPVEQIPIEEFEVLTTPSP